MNDLTLMSPAVGVTLHDRAQRIRDLVGTARTCIIEIGRELIAARHDLAHGEWLPWLKDEFGWTERTAQKYVAVAEAFGKYELGSHFDGLTIDATALYALAAPDVPPAVRDEAIERAEAGEHITKATADAMIADAVEAAVAAQRDATATFIADKEREVGALREQIEQARAQSNLGITEATNTLISLQGAYDRAIAERDAARQELEHPSEGQIVHLVSLLTRKKPGRLMLVALASAIGQTITYAGKEYAPVAHDELAKMRLAKAASDEKLTELFDPNGAPARWHKALLALRTLNALDGVELLMARRYDGFDHAFAAELPKAERWITDFAKGMRHVGHDRDVAGRRVEEPRAPHQGSPKAGRGRGVRHG